MLAACQQAEKQAAERLEALSGESGLCREISLIRDSEAELEEEKEKLLRLTENAGNASVHAEALYQAFIAAQAAVLADELRQTLAENEETVCPVCGTHLHQIDLPHLAKLPEDAPDQAAVDEARQAAAQAEQERSEQNAAVHSLLAALTMRKQALVDRAFKLLPNCDSWEALTAAGVLDRAVEEAQAEHTSCKDALGSAEKDKTERDTLRQQLPKKEQTLQSIQEQIADLQGQEQEQQGIIKAAEAAAAVLHSQLHQDEEAARQEKARMEERVGVLTLLIQAHQNTLTEKKRKQATILGSLTEKEKAAEKLTVAHSVAASECERVLAETGFESSAAVKAVLEALGSQDAELWLKTERTKLTEHELSKENTHNLIETRKVQTAGKQLEDLGALEEEKQQISDRHAAIRELCTEQEQLLNNHRMVLERASGIKKALADSDRAWKRLDALGSLAGGVNSESGKLSLTVMSWARCSGKSWRWPTAVWN